MSIKNQRDRLLVPALAVAAMSVLQGAAVFMPVGTPIIRDVIVHRSAAVNAPSSAAASDPDDGGQLNGDPDDGGQLA